MWQRVRHEWRALDLEGFANRPQCEIGRDVVDAIAVEVRQQLQCRPMQLAELKIVCLHKQCHYAVTCIPSRQTVNAPRQSRMQGWPRVLNIAWAG